MSERVQRELLTGIVEADETYIGGKPRKGNTTKGGKNKRGRGTKKTAVVGLAQRVEKLKLNLFTINVLPPKT